MDRIALKHKEKADEAFSAYGYGTFEEVFAYFYCYCDHSYKHCYVEETEVSIAFLVGDLRDSSWKCYVYSNGKNSWVPQSPNVGTRFYCKGKGIEERQDAVIDVERVLKHEGSEFAALRRKLRKFEMFKDNCKLEDVRESVVQTFLVEWEELQGRKYEKANCVKDLRLVEEFFKQKEALNLVGSFLRTKWGRLIGVEISAYSGVRSSSLLMKSLPVYDGSAYWLRMQQLQKLKEVGVQYDNVESPFQTKGVEQFKMTFRPTLLSVRYGGENDQQRQD